MTTPTPPPETTTHATEADAMRAIMLAACEHYRTGPDVFAHGPDETREAVIARMTEYRVRNRKVTHEKIAAATGMNVYRIQAILSARKARIEEARQQLAIDAQRALDGFNRSPNAGAGVDAAAVVALVAARLGIDPATKHRRKRADIIRGVLAWRDGPRGVTAPQLATALGVPLHVVIAARAGEDE